MKITDTIACLNAYLDADQPVFLWGPPGIGKSDVVREVARTREANLIDLRAITFDPVDLRGLPAVDVKNRRAAWCLPEFLPYEDRDGPVGVLFLDELNAAPQSVMAACFQLVLERRIGDYKLPKRWRIVAAGNRQSDGAAAQKMPTPLANRFAHIDVEHSAEEWCEWAAKQGADECLVAFIKFRPTLLHNMDGKDLRAFPTPRAWMSVSKILQTHKVSGHTGKQLVGGLVGEDAAQEFTDFHKLWHSIPTIDEIRKAPLDAAVPKNTSQQTALSQMMAENICTEDLVHFLVYAKRLDKENEVSFVLASLKKAPSLKDHGAIKKWLEANPNTDISKEK